MNGLVKAIQDLTIADLVAFPVWQYANSDTGDETAVLPVDDIPVRNLTGRVVSAKGRLANGRGVWSLVGNVESGNPRLTHHFFDPFNSPRQRVVHDGALSRFRRQ